MAKRQVAQSGFTLVEIMIAVAIVGILAVIALPQYQDYAIRSKVTECLNFSSPAKIAVSESRATQQSGVHVFTQTRYCADVQVAGNGTIVLTTKDTGAKVAPVLQLVPQAAGSGVPIRWDCQFVAGKPAHVPPECRSPGTLVAMDSIADTPSGGTDGAGGDGGSPAGGAADGGVTGVDSGDDTPAPDSGGDDPGEAADAGDAPVADAPPPGDDGVAAPVSGGDGGGDATPVAGGGDEPSGPSAGGGAAAGGSDTGAGLAPAGGDVGGADPVEEGAQEEEKDPVDGCPYKHPNGKPHLSKCKKWLEEQEKEQEPDPAPVEECPHKLGSGKPHPAKCKEWEKENAGK